MNFTVFDSFNEDWVLALENFPLENRDINYLPNWYRTWIDHEKAEAKCIYAIVDGYHLLYPFFLKRINNYELDREYFDIQSAYGYGGVIASSLDIPDSTAKKFNKLVDEWLTENNVIAEFIRVHPLLNHFKRDADYCLVRRNVYVETNDLYRIPDKQARQNIAKSKLLNVTAVYDKDMEHMDEFMRLYSTTAERLNMHHYYRFGPEYFESVKNELREYASLIHVVWNDVIIASGLYFNYNGRANLHLAGSLYEYQHLRPNDMLYDATINYSIKTGATILNLGGGTTSSPDDSLFRFKSKYSNQHKDVLIGKKIINQNVYSKIIGTWEQKHPQLQERYNNYFLKYHYQS